MKTISTILFLCIWKECIKCIQPSVKLRRHSAQKQHVELTVFAIPVNWHTLWSQPIPVWFRIKMKTIRRILLVWTWKECEFTLNLKAQYWATFAAFAILVNWHTLQNKKRQPSYPSQNTRCAIPPRLHNLLDWIGKETQISFCKCAWHFCIQLLAAWIEGGGGRWSHKTLCNFS